MTVQVDLGTQATDSSLIEEEASRLPHCTIQRSFPFAVLVCLLWTCNTSIRYRWLGSDHQTHCQVQPTLPESTSLAHSAPSIGRGGGGPADSPRKCRGCCRFHQMSIPLCHAR